LSKIYCQKYTPADCFFGDFARWGMDIGFWISSYLHEGEFFGSGNTGEVQP